MVWGKTVVETETTPQSSFKMEFVFYDVQILLSQRKIKKKKVAKHANEDTQEIPESRSAALLMQQRTKR